MARTQGSHARLTGPKLRDAAARLIARHGFAAVSMRQIAAEIGLQAGALYLYTPDKQTLLYDLMREHLEELLASLPPDDGPPVRRLETFTRHHVAFHLDRQEQVFVAYMELRNLAPENFAAIEALRRSYEDRLQGILRDGVAVGGFAVADTKVTTLAIIAMLTGPTTWFREGGRLSRAALADHYWGMVRQMVAA